MFDVSWTDPERETVGQRKSRKDQHGNFRSHTPSIRRSTSVDLSSRQTKPSLLTLFGGSKKAALARTGSHSKLSALSTENTTKASRRVSSYTIASTDSSSLEVSEITTTTRIPTRNFFSGGPYQSDGEHSSPSDGTSSQSQVCLPITSFSA